MHVHSSKAEIIETWGYRFLYLSVFLFGVVSMFYLSYPPTFFYLGAVFSLFYIAQIWKYYKKELLEDDVHK